jgi:hypothetical protein
MRVAIVGGPGLRHIIETAGLPPFDEVPYRVMDRFDPA